MITFTNLSKLDQSQKLYPIIFKDLLNNNQDDIGNNYNLLPTATTVLWILCERKQEKYALYPRPFSVTWNSGDQPAVDKESKL